MLTKMLLWLKWKAVLMIFGIGFWMINWNWMTTRLSFWWLVHPSNSLKVTISSLRVGISAITPMSSARNLGSWFDAKLTMATPITRTCNSASYYLYNLRRIRKYLSKENTKTLVHAFISSRIDYCNSLLYGAPEYQINKLQRVQHMCARLICNESKYCHITPLLMELHWLPIKLRIEF